MNCWGILIPVLIVLKLSSNTTGIGIYFTRSPESLVAPLHDEVVFDCTLNIDVDYIKWRHNSEDFTHPVSIHTSTNSRLVVKVESIAETGDYQCVAIIGASSLASTAATLSLATLKEFENQSLSNDEKFIVTAGNTVALNCGKPIQSDPLALIQYYKNDQALPRTTPVSSAGSVLLKNIQFEHSGHYTCSATNNILSQVVKSPMSIYLDVRSSHTALSPRFISKPPSLYVAQKNSNVSIECAPYGEPVPKIQWLGIHKNILLNDNKTNIEPGLLTIRNLSVEDSGIYECMATNSYGLISYSITLQVQELPYVKSGPSEFVVINEGSSETLKCEAMGTPTPKIIWYLNGKPVNDSNILTKGGVLTFNNTQKNHAGFVQCFACNILGCSYWTAIVQVNPKQIKQQTSQQHYYEDSTMRSPQRDRKDRNHKGKGRKNNKKKKGNEMIPPSQPNVTRLTENSVMVRWNVPPNDGLPIRFFKLQYKEVGGSWNTSSDDIQMHIRCYQVDKLLPDHEYVFKIAAVYSNDDNKSGPTSKHFFLNRGPPNRSLIPPTLLSAKAVNTTSILLEWEYRNAVLVPVQGFYVYYRATSTAGDYTKAIVEGNNARMFFVTHLSPDTSYDIKLQSFTVHEASNFSSILTHKTFGELKTSTDTPKRTDSTADNGTNNSTSSTIGGVKSLYVLLGAVIAVIAATILLIFFTICMYSRRSLTHSNSPELNKSTEAVSGLEPLSMNGFTLKNGKMVNGCTLPMASDNTHGHAHPPNGYVIHPINITSNPLAPDAKNAVEISFLANHNNNCSENEMNSLPRRAMPIPSTDTPRTWRSKDAKDENYV